MNEREYIVTPVGEPELIGWGDGTRRRMGRRWSDANPPAGSLAERELKARRRVPPPLRAALRPWRMRLTPRRRWKYSAMKPITWVGRWTATVFLAAMWLAWAVFVCGLIAMVWTGQAVIVACQWLAALTVAGMHPGRHRRT